MKVHHLNTTTLCPWGGRHVGGEGGFFHRAPSVCHVLLIESPGGLVLVDTGCGAHAVTDPIAQMGRGFVTVFQPKFVMEETAVAQVEALGFDRLDVRHIIATHLDLDHAGGLADFPAAAVHVFKPEYEAATHPADFKSKARYRRHMWAHNPQWHIYDQQGEPWFGFEAVRELEGLPPEILMVPLVGHCPGLCAAAVKSDRGWLMHCGDAYFKAGEIDPVSPTIPPLLKFFEKNVAWDYERVLANHARLAGLQRDHSDEVEVFCAHDVDEFNRLRTASN
ncbi:MBL fold metallo-hydrolase [bacterium]|nr:MBL fold metallo-hydrolase [bacterium]